MNEIEKSIYNVILACQMVDGKIRYHNCMEGKKDNPSICENTCCEAQGTRILGSLPEYIYSTAIDGIYINLYEPSSINCDVAGTPVTLAMDSKFPYNNHVTVKLATSKPVKMKLRVRIPAWASGDMAVNVNGKKSATGKPGSYATLDRTWTDNDVITFELPMDLRVTRYIGSDTIPGHERFAVEYGPVLLAAVGDQLPITINHDPKQVKQWLVRKAPDSLEFTAKGEDKTLFKPYFRINEEVFTTFPVMEGK